jgi:protein O-GlcNAc transferase
VRRGFSSGGTQRKVSKRERNRFVQRAGDSKKAQLTYMERMIKALPIIADAHVAYERQDWDGAEAKIRELLDVHHMATPMVYDSLGSCLQYQGRFEDAIEAFRQALAMDPTYSVAHDRIIMILDAMPSTTVEKAQRERDRWWTRYGEQKYAKRRPHLNNRDPERPLRVGYVSGDYQYHSAATVFHRIIMQHTEGFIPYLYSMTPSKHWATTVTQGFAYHPNWRNLVDVKRGEMGLDEDRPWPASMVYGKILDDQIDILVDLSAYTAHNRLDVFCMKPAPIQITGWGYATGVGWPAMDYLVTDRVVVPEDQQHLHVEKMLYVPSIIDYEPTLGLPEANPLPCLTERPTFGVLQRSLKINTDDCEVWRQILERLPESRLIMKGQYSQSLITWITGLFKAQASQVEFQPVTSSYEHKCAYQQVDLNLDPWPQTAGVSGCDGLWMGVPMITLEGRRVIERTSMSLLTSVGLTDMIASSKADYVNKAVEWVTTRKHELAEIRQGLRAKCDASPIRAGYLDAVESAYREAWRAWCAKPLSVSDLRYRLEMTLKDTRVVMPVVPVAAIPATTTPWPAQPEVKFPQVSLHSPDEPIVLPAPVVEVEQVPTTVDHVLADSIADEAAELEAQYSWLQPQPTRRYEGTE